MVQVRQSTCEARCVNDVEVFLMEKKEYEAYDGLRGCHPGVRRRVPEGDITRSLQAFKPRLTPFSVALYLQAKKLP